MDAKFPHQLQEFVSAQDDAFQWKRSRRNGRITRFRLTSQIWQGSAWEHDIVLVEPERRIAKGAAILYVTGGEPNPLDLDEAHRLASLSGLPVAHMFQIPNQPLYDLWEDDLIAYTFERYLDTGDPSWPLLLPMTKSAIKAMDALQEASARGDNPLDRFIVTGASKRGWTSWLVAASGDKRVVGIAPMVYDNLNLGAQLENQVQSWNRYSDMISPYTDRGLHDRMNTPEGQRLAAMVDPYTYREELSLPKLIVTGTNDPYWSVDSLSVYWDDLPGSKWASAVPNAGHGLGDMSQALHVIAAFSRRCVDRLEMPKPRWSFEKDAVEIQSEAPLPELCLWIAESESLDFRESTWWPRLESGPGKLKAEQLAVKLNVPKSKRNQAVMVEVRYRIKDLAFSLTTPVKVYRA